MHFRESVWNDSDPLYAPCQKKVRSSYYWIPPKKYLDEGFATKSVRLEGHVGDDLAIERARHCRALTRDMLTWYDGERQGKEPGTWAWLVGRYIHDPESDIQEVKANTHQQYRDVAVMIENGIGDVLLEETDFIRMRTWMRAMKDNGRSQSYIQRWFRHLSMVASYGIKIGDKPTREECERIQLIRRNMRIKSGPRRQVFASREQVYAVVAEADARNWHHLSLSLLIRFELILRGVDVYGQWVKKSEDVQGGIQHHGKIWIDGLTWDNIGPDCATITKQISKTKNSMPEPYNFDLANLPDISRRLAMTPKDQRTGPVITAHGGLPPKQGMMGKWFKQIVRDLGLPEELQIRDTRAGGITEAKDMVAPTTLQHAAQHQNQNTTDRYTRDRSSSANQVIEIRSRRGA